MDGLRHPVGEEPTNVYWVRRAGVIAAVVIFGLLLWWLISAFGGSGDGNTPGGSPSVESTADSTTSPEPTAAQDPARACTEADLAVTTTSPLTFSGSSPAEFTVSVTLASGNPCTVDPTTDGSALLITSGDDAWFDSSACEAYAVYGEDAQPFIMQEGADKKLTATWNFGRGEAACSGGAQDAQPGFYWVTASVQGAQAERVQFEVT